MQALGSGYRRLRLVVAIGGVLAASVAAPSQALPKPAFVARGNAICRAYYQGLNKLAAPVMTTSGVAAYERKQLPLMLTESRQFAAIGPPARDRSAFHKWLTVSDASTGVVKDVIAAGERNDAAAVNRLFAKGAALDRSYNALAAKLGLMVCAQPTSK